jgi:hypothetical protein
MRRFTHNRQPAIHWTPGAKELTVFIGDWRSRSLENNKLFGARLLIRHRRHHPQAMLAVFAVLLFLVVSICRRRSLRLFRY